MFVTQLSGSPFDNRILLEVESDDGVFQHVYVARSGDDVAVVVWEPPTVHGATARARFDYLDSIGLRDPRAILVDEV